MYENLISDIRAAIKANGNQEITGPILQDVLVGIVNALGAGVPCGGVLSPGDTPAPQQPIFYLAGPGVYNAAGLTTVGEGCIGLTIFDGSSWSADTIDTGLAGEVSTINDALATINATLLDKMDKVPLAIENRFAQFNNNGNVKDGGFEAVEHIDKDDATNKHLPTEKAVVEALTGKQELLVAGAAEGILGPSAATGLAQVLTAPSSGVSVIDTIKGRTLKWNQLATAIAAGTVTSNNVTYTNDNKGDLTITVGEGGATGNVLIPICNKYGLWINGNKYLCRIETNFVPSSSTIRIGNNYYLWWDSASYIWTASGTSGGYAVQVVSGCPAGTYTIKNANIANLTTTFGAGNEPTTVAEFTALFPNFPYSYNAGTLLPFKGAGLKVTGFNQWDEQWEQGIINSGTGENGYSVSNSRTKGYIRVCEGETYYFKSPYILYTRLYDINKNYISAGPNRQNSTYTVPSGVAYIRFVTDYPSITLGDICINLSNPSLNGTYKPYTETLVNIDAIGKTAKDADGNAIVPFPTGVNGFGASFDQYDKIGGTLRFGVRAYTSGDESDATVMTDLTNTVYPLTTPVPFTWDEPFTLAFSAEEGGTIWLQPEGVDAQGVPATAPLNADIAYTVPAGSIITETTLRNLLDEFKAKGIFSAYTMTPDGAGNFNFTITV